MADAYYVLSDATRRREYDILLSSRPSASHSSEPASSGAFFADFARFFSGGAAAPEAGTSTSSGAKAGPSPQAYGPGVAPNRPDAEYVFTDVFGDLLTPEVERTLPWWSWVGTVSGAGIGFIMANIPGETCFVDGFDGGDAYPRITQVPSWVVQPGTGSERSETLRGSLLAWSLLN